MPASFNTRAEFYFMLRYMIEIISRCQAKAYKVFALPLRHLKRIEEESGKCQELHWLPEELVE